MGAGVGKGKNELVSDINFVLPGGRVGKGGYRGHFGSRYTLRVVKNVVRTSAYPNFSAGKIRGNVT